MSTAQNLAFARGIQQISRGYHSPTTEPLARSSQLTAPLACHQCGAIDTPLIAPSKNPHYTLARCWHYGHFIRWLSQYRPGELDTQRQQAMAQKPPSLLQRAYLAALGDTGPPLASMPEVSEQMDAALQRGEVRV